MSYRADIYDDGTAAIFNDSDAVGMTVRVPGRQLVESKLITEDKFNQLRAQQEAYPGSHLTYDSQTGEFSVTPIASS